MCTVPVSPVICVSLHDALPILTENGVPAVAVAGAVRSKWSSPAGDTETLAEPVFVVSTVSLTVIVWEPAVRSEEHTSELQSHSALVCRVLLEDRVAPAPPPVKC